MQILKRILSSFHKINKEKNKEIEEFKKHLYESISQDTVVIRNIESSTNYIDCYYFIQAERRDIPKLKTEL
jgi:hypothetical protein